MPQRVPFPGVQSWEILREELVRIRAEEPRAVLSSPGIDHLPGHSAPVRIHLEAWAVPIAQRLHDTLGGYVELTVGVLRFPQRERVHAAGSEERIADADRAIVSVDTDGDPVARAGRVLDTKVRVTNLSGEHLTLTLSSDRTLYGVVIDPASGEVVNGDLRWAPLTADVRAKIRPGYSLRLDARVPTASCLPSLGYSVPAGDWKVRFRLRLRGGVGYSPPLPLRIIDDGPSTWSARRGAS